MLLVKQKVLALITAIALISSQLYAVALTDVLNGTSVSSDFGTWKSPRTGGKYFYGGSYTFAFKGAGRYQPIFQGEAPSSKMGCNGFSLRGGFIQLLGLNEIKFLLKNAGATLAWGVMVALYSSMPLLSKTFETLRKFARELQKLLANACNFGQLIVDKTEFGKQAKGFLQDATNSLIGDANKFFDDSMVMGEIEKWGSRLENFNKGVEAGCSNYTDEALKDCLNKKGENASSKAAQLAQYNSSSVLSYTIGAYARKNTAPTNQISISTMSDFFNTGNIGQVAVITDKNRLSEIKTTILLSRLFFGDYTTHYDSLDELMRYTGGGTISEGSYEIDVSKAKDEVLSELSGQIKEMNKGAGWTSAVISSSEQAAKALIDGITSDIDSVACSNDGYCNVNNDYLYYISLSTGSDKIETIGSVKRNDVNSIRVVWKGAFRESLEVIRAMVQTRTGYAPTFTAPNESTPDVKSPSASDIKIPLLLPNINKYLDSIVLLEKKAKGETPFTAQLKSILARYNGYFFATGLIDLIVGNVVSALGAKGSPAGDPDIRKMENYLKLLMDKRDAILEKIKEEEENQISYTDLTELFEKVDINIRKENIKGY